MRLNDDEIAAVKRASALTFGPDAIVRLYGSRVCDERRGGDIDLHVETREPIDFWRKRPVFLEHLFARIDEQRVDLIVTIRGARLQPIEAIAYRDGVVL